MDDTGDTNRDSDPALDCGSQRDLVERVRTRVRRSLEGRQPVSRAVMARQLGMSERSLSRHMRALGTSYAREVDHVRIGRAMEMLRDGDSIEHVRDALGYRHSSALYRLLQRTASQLSTPYIHDALWREPQ